MKAIVCLVLAASLGMSLSSCRDSSASNKNTNAATSVVKTNTHQNSKIAAPAIDTVVITMMKFEPATLKVHAGDTVVWINKGVVAHDVTEDNNAWRSGTGNIHPGETYKHVVNKSFTYHCSIHPTMKGSVTVIK